MTIAGIFGDIANGMTAWFPALGKGVLDLFVNLFISYTESSGTITYNGLNPLGTFAIVSLVIAVGYKVLPLAFNFISKKMRARRARKARA